MIRLLVCGERDWDDDALVWSELDRELVRAERLGLLPLVLVHGACPTGADHHADRWAEARGLTVERYPADWNALDEQGRKLGRRAGPTRNGVMARTHPDRGVAFWSGRLDGPRGDGGSGTVNMLSQATAHGVAMRIVPPRRR